MRVEILTEIFDPHTELARFTSGRENAGALTSFVGYCRADGGRVETLELQHYPGLTEREIERLAAETVRRHKLLDLLVLHRVGTIAPGDAIVLVAALSVHRAAAFAAVEVLMDALKTDAPIWKREVSADGARWIEPTPADRERRARQEVKP